MQLDVFDWTAIGLVSGALLLALVFVTLLRREQRAYERERARRREELDRVSAEIEKDLGDKLTGREGGP